MATKDQILKRAKKGETLKASELSKALKIARQTISDHLKRLVDDGILEKSGSTKNATYRLVTGKLKKQKIQVIKLVKSLKNLEENAVFDEIDFKMHLKGDLPENVYRIVAYSFQEMLNNAIDHSQSQKAWIISSLDNKNVEFQIKDLGIGAFANIQKTFHLKNEFEAIEHLLKGKQTTFAERHSGQGIFFTSKIADEFKIKSHKSFIYFDNKAKDLKGGEEKRIKGTEVFFRINRNSKKKLIDLFNKYSNEDFEFDRTNLSIKLTAERELLARSQARRILYGLDDFKIVTLDFKQVKEVGQAFVDEIFRVYKNKNPEKQIIYINANPAVEFMIQRGMRG